MVSIAARAALALTLICIARIKTKMLNGASECRVHPRAGLPLIGVQIICGDCSGDGVQPIKTHMDRHGRCETCGGKSYMLASRRGAEMNQKRAAALPGGPSISRPTGQEPAKSGQLLAFRTTAGRRRAN
jgi:hypothetical protein